MRKLLVLLALVCVGCAKEPEPQQYPQYSPFHLHPENPIRNEPIRPLWTEKTFRGEWVTTRNRRLDGTMNCTVTRKGHEQWTGRFWGVWQGVDFDYDVEFDGPLDNLKGKPCTIDGARYQWDGSIVGGVFNAEFTGSRYTGSFVLTEQ